MSVTSAYSEFDCEITGQLPFAADLCGRLGAEPQKVLRAFGETRELDNRLPVIGTFHTSQRSSLLGPRNAQGQHRGVILDTGAEATEQTMDLLDDCRRRCRGVRLCKTQQRTLVVVTLGADAGAGFRQPVCVEHHRVARVEMKPARDEMGLSGEADRLAADRVDVVGAAAGMEQERRRVAPAGNLDVETVVALRQLSVDHCAEAITNIP